VPARRPFADQLGDDAVAHLGLLHRPALPACKRPRHGVGRVLGKDAFEILEVGPQLNDAVPLERVLEL
jgi:hypothetical protein